MSDSLDMDKLGFDWLDSDVQAEYSIGVELNAVELIHSLFDFDLQNLVLSMSLLQFNFLLHQVFFQDVVLVGCDS